MTNFHAVMIDETGCEFGASVTAPTRAAAFAKLREDYPESRCDQLESPADTQRRQARIERWANHAYENPGASYGDDY